MWQPPLPIPWLPLQACHRGKEKRECEPPVTQTHQHSTKSEKLCESCSEKMSCLWGALCHRAEWDKLWQGVGSACGSTSGNRGWGSRAGTVGKTGQKHLRPRQGTSAAARKPMLARECWGCCSFKGLRADQPGCSSAREPPVRIFVLLSVRMVWEVTCLGFFVCFWSFL